MGITPDLFRKAQPSSGSQESTGAVQQHLQMIFSTYKRASDRVVEQRRYDLAGQLTGKDPLGGEDGAHGAPMQEGATHPEKMVILVEEGARAEQPRDAGLRQPRSGAALGILRRAQVLPRRVPILYRVRRSRLP